MRINYFREITLAVAFIAGSIAVVAGWVPSWTLSAAAIVVVGAAVVSEARTKGIDGVSLVLWLLLALMASIVVDEAFPELVPSVVSIGVPLVVLVAFIVIGFREDDDTPTTETSGE